MARKTSKIENCRCVDCGAGELITEPNQYDILTFSGGQFEIDHTKTIDDFKIFCRECSAEINDY